MALIWLTSLEHLVNGNVLDTLAVSGYPSNRNHVESGQPLVFQFIPGEGCMETDAPTMGFIQNITNQTSLEVFS